MALTRSPAPGQFRVGVEVWFPLLASLYGVAAASLWFSDTITTAQMVTLLGAPPVALIAVVRPAWPLLLLLALPAGVLGVVGVSAGDLSLLLLLVVATPVLVRGRLYFSWRSPFVFFFVLLALATVLRADVGAVALATAHATLGSFLYFALLAFGAYSLARHGELTARHLEVALLVGVTLTALILLVLSGFDPATLLTDHISGAGRSEYELYRTHFGMLMVMGLAVALTRVFRHEDGGWKARPGLMDILLMIFLVVMVGLSLTRAAWLAAALLSVLIVWRTRRKAYFIIPLLIAVAILTIPVLNERAFGDVSQGFDRAVQSGELASGRLALWDRLGERVAEGFPLGHGFGYTWTLTPEDLFKVADVFVTAENPLVYPHNDFLYWALELGVVGVALYALFWLKLLAQWVYLNRHPSAGAQRIGLVFGGILVTMLVAEIVDNGLFMQPVAERFFAVAGFVVATATAWREAPSEAARESASSGGQDRV